MISVKFCSKLYLYFLWTTLCLS